MNAIANPTRAELAGIMAVMQAAFDPAYGEAWNERQVQSSLLVPGTRFTLIDAAGVIGPPAQSVQTAGFYLARQVIDEEELLLLAVVPGLRRRGLASRLLEHLIVSARDRGTKRLHLEMREDNPALSFYKRFDFREVGLRLDYYRGPDGSLRNAHTLALDLTDRLA